MVFSSLEFLFLFLPAILLAYFAVPVRLRNPVLLAGSLFFYAWGEPVYIVLMLVSITVNYGLALAIDRFRGTPRSRAALIGAVAISLGLLGYFKYAGFLMDTINGLLGTDFVSPDLPLPIGISFYTFQIISYTVDVYRRDVPAQRSWVTLAMYISLFPQLIAGPIVRYKTIAAELTHRTPTLERFAEGAGRFTIGLAKKVIIANNIGLIWKDTLLSSEPSVLLAWLGLTAFALQIYFDFSGYSDMAIGLGRILGFTFPENFDYPYVSQTVTEFWRRWHMSLGQWFRDYVYIPMGGNRVPYLAWVRNVLVVWFLTGLWHGAAWNFALWGVYFGVLMIVEKAFLHDLLYRLPRMARHAYLIFAVLISWTLFELGNIAQIEQYLATMFGLAGVPIVNDESVYVLRSNLVLFVVAIGASVPLLQAVQTRIPDRPFIRQAGVPAIQAVLLVVSYAYLLDSTFNPFLYFRF
ncbi:MAG: MBOAT family protein [Chloroflexota bacterium]|jgi:alginate O-acetyltransferase complex protein AlgI|nr:MBOAT family protein [Chloroflexota bacterium]MDH5243157.1 MBOAT family protein [Chloroflexota bacterium]